MRCPNWPRKLNEYFVSVKDAQFEYGVHDCCTFSAGAVQAITGEDLMSEFRGKYSTREESQSVLKSIGAGTLLRTLRKKFGPPVNGASGQRGDVAWYNGACGIIIGRDGIFLTQDGYGTAAISRIKWAFHVPFE